MKRKKEKKVMYPNTESIVPSNDQTRQILHERPVVKEDGNEIKARIWGKRKKESMLGKSRKLRNANAM